MNNLEIAKAAIMKGRQWYNVAIHALGDKQWDDVIYLYEMAIEQALKGILILFGIEFPKKHDISSVYQNLKTKNIPEEFKNKMDEHAKILKYLVVKRGISANGYREGIKKNEFEKDAKKYRKSVLNTIKDCENLLKLL